jgi:SdrD B-like domain
MNRLLLRFVVKVFVPCFILIIFTAFFSEIQAQNVTGKVFRDFNANGQQSSTNPIEPSVQGVTVKAYKADGTLLDTKTTASDGTYTLTVGTSSQVRIEFSNLPSAYFGGPKGSNSSTTVQFVNGGGTANLGVNYPSDYCGTTDPQLVTPCYVNGTPLNGGNSADDPFIVTVPYTPTGNGTSLPAGSNASENAYLSKGKEVGATWGITYQRSSKFIFTSALLKRHSGFGSGGPGAIYKIDVSGATQVTTLFVDLNADLGVSAGTDPRNQSSAADSLSKFKTQPNRDSTAFGIVGKMSLGDIDISDDEKTLWVVNTFDRKLYELPVGSPAVKPTTKIAHTLPNPGCTNGVFRPWATKFWRGKVYVGGVCTAENGGDSTNLKAYIYSFTPGDANPNNFTQVATFPLNYKRGYTSISSTTNKTSAAWKPWIAKWSDITNPAPDAATYSQTICPQPMLSDIEFDVDGSMIIGFMDRAGHQLGNNNYSTLLNDLNTTTGKRNLYEGTSAGDILRAGLNADGTTYSLESNATVNGVISGGTNQNPAQGPSGGEFYWQDMYGKSSNKNYPDGAAGGGHQEISLGGLALLPGKNEVVETVFDPVNAFRAGGVRWFDNTTGASPRGYEIFGQDAGGQGVTFGKANGLGDLELLCAVQPIEVGNRIWNDLDRDGIQDAGEPALAGVEVELWKNGVKVSGTTTSSTGEYYFTDLLPNMDYEIRILNVKGTSKQTNLLGLEPTQANTNANGLDNIDSDASITGANTYAVIPFTTGNYGENNHTLDAGFTCIKPIANPSATAVKVCEPATTVDLTDAATGTEPQTWSVLATGNPSTSQITSSTGVVTGMTGIGVYKYVLTSTLTGCKDTVSVTRNAQPNAGADQKVCTPTQTAQLVAASTGEVWSAQAGNPSNATVINAGNVAGMTSTGGYFVILTDANACKDTVEVLRVERPNAGVDITVCSPTQTATLTAANTTLGQTWAASNSNPALSTINNAGNVAGMTVDGIYTFGLTQNGCTDSVKITRQTGGVVNALGSIVCAGQNWNLSTSTIAVSYTWTGPSGFTSTQKSPSITNATINNAGTYTLVANFAAGCTASATATVVVNLSPIATATNNSPFCAGSELKLTATGAGSGTPPAYQWAGPSGFTATTSNPSIPNASASFSGIYTVLVTNAAGCTATATTVVVINPNPSVTATGVEVCQGQVAQITLVTPLNPTFAWTGPNGFSSTLNNPIITNAQPNNTGIYSVNVTSAAGCTATATATVVVNPSPTATAVSNSPVCLGSPINLTATGGTSYAWTGPTAFTANIANPTIPVSTLSLSGTYSVLVTNTAGCTATATTVVVVNNCAKLKLGDLVWNDVNNNGKFDAGTEIGIKDVVVNLYLDANNDGTPDSVTPLATTTTDATGLYKFENLAENKYIVEIVAPATYKSSTGTNGSATGPNEGAATPGDDNVNNDDNGNTFSGQIIRTKTVELTNGNEPINDGDTDNNSNLSVDFGLFIPASLGSTVWNDTNNDGIKDPTELGIDNVTVKLLDGAGNVVATTTTNPSGVYSFDNLIPGTYVVEFVKSTLPAGFEFSPKDQGGNDTRDSDVDSTTGKTDPITLTAGQQKTDVFAGASLVCTKPVVQVTATSPRCEGSNVQLTVSGGGSYLWTGPAGFTSTVSNPSFPLASVSNSGTYTVTVTSSGTCIATAQATIAVIINAVPTVTAVGSTVCSGGNIQLTATSTGSILYEWSGPSAFASTLSNPQIANATVSNSGVYTVKVTNPNGCTANATAQVSVGASLSVTATSNSPVCVGKDLTLSSNGGAGATYAWTGPNNFVSTAAAVTIAQAQLLANGVYSVKVTNTDGCTGTATTAVIVNPVPTIAPVSAEVCQGGNVTITMIGGVGYSWTGPNNFTATTAEVTLSNVTPANAGAYTVVVSNVNQCTSTALANVIVNPSPTVSATGATVCTGGTLQLSASSVAGATYAWVGPNNFTSTAKSPTIANATVSNAGTYGLIVTDLKGCKATATATVSVGASLSVTATSNSPVCVGKDLTLSSNGGAGATYEWTGPNNFVSTAAAVTIAQAQLLANGVYSVKVTNTDGCTGTATTAVTVNPVPTIAPVSAEVCQGGNVTITMIGGVGYSWTGPNNFTATTAEVTLTNVTPANAGAYTVVVSNVNQCTSTALANVIVNPSPTVSATGAIACTGGKLQLSASSVAGATYAWVGPNNFTSTAKSPTIANATVLNSGTYGVLVTDLKGCKATANATASVTPKLNGGNDVTICDPITSAKITVVAGATWTPEVTNPKPLTINQATGDVTGMTVNGIYVLYLSNGDCSDTISIFRNQKLDAGGDQVLCSPKSTTKLLATTTGQTWSSPTVPVGATVVIDAQGNVTGISVDGIYKFVLTQNGNPSCTDTVMVTRAAAPNAGTDQTGNSGICEAIQIAKLQAATATQTWTVAATGNPAIATIDQNGNVAKMTVNGVYVFILKQGDCADSVKIERIAKPVAGDDVKICEPLTIAKVKATTTGQTWTPASGNPANATVNASGEISGLTVNGIYQFVFTANGCTDTLNVERFGIPNAGTDLVGNKAICEPSEVAKLTTPPAGSTWTVATGNPATATVSATGEIAKMTVNGIYTFILKNANGCADSVKVERSASPKAGADTTICGDISVIKLQNAPQNQAWSAAAGNPTSATINPVTGEVIGMTTNGVYKFVLSSIAGCTDTLKVERLPLPIFDAATEQASCTGSTPADDAKLVLTNFGTGNRYDYSEGITYSGTKTYATATAIPVTGIIANNLVNPTAVKTYTVRVFNANGCYLDKTVILNPRICECKPDVCAPFVAMKTKSGRP